jgi:hypothetical protein
VDVIPFHQWRVYCFVDANGNNVIRSGMDREGMPEADRWALHSRIKLLEQSEPSCLPGFVVPVADGFYMLALNQTGRLPISPICCYGPFGGPEVLEITLLAWAPIEQGRLQAQDVLPVARDNFEILVEEGPSRRIYEPVVGRISRRFPK